MLGSAPTGAPARCCSLRPLVGVCGAALVSALLFFWDQHLPMTPKQCLATYQVNLNLPDGKPEDFKDAATAVHQEHRSSVRWKRLRCRKVQKLTGHDDNTIFSLEIGHSISSTGRGKERSRSVALIRIHSPERLRPPTISPNFLQ